jgi:hypothetical protein
MNEPWLAAASEAIMSGDGDRALTLVAEIRSIDEPSRYLIDMSRFYETWGHLFRGDLDASLTAAVRHEPDLRGGAFEYLVDWAFARLETDPTEALARYERAISQAARTGSKFIVLGLEREIGHLQLVTGEPRAALEALTPLCEQWYAADDATNWAATLCILAPTFAALSDWTTAVLLLGAVDDRRTYALPMAGMQASELDELADRCKIELGEAAFEHEYRFGKKASVKELMDRLRSAISRLLTAPSTRQVL